MSGWGCPHELQGACQRVKGLPCDPGMKGCVLFGRFVFSNPEKNRPPDPRRDQRRDRERTAAPPDEPTGRR